MEYYKCDKCGFSGTHKEKCVCCGHDKFKIIPEEQHRKELHERTIERMKRKSGRKGS